MSKFILLIISCIISFGAFAQQPWAPIHPDKMYSYKKIEHLEKQYLCWNCLPENNNFVQNIKVLKDSVVGADTIFILSRRAKPISFSTFLNTYIWDFENSNFLNSEIRATSSGEYYFQGNDTFLLKPQAALNDSWIYKDTITATVISIEPIIQWNFSDSLKTILLSNNDTILLSRNFGILKFPDPDSIGMYIEILGLQKDTLTWGLRTPDFWDTYNLSVGDILMYSWWYAYAPSGYDFGLGKIVITQKNLLSNGIYYEFHKFGYSLPFNTTDSTITFLIDSCQYLNGLQPNLMSFSITIDSSLNSTTMSLAVLDSNNQIVKYNLQKLGDWMPIPPLDSLFSLTYKDVFRFEPGIGFTMHDFSGFESVSYTELIGYVNNGDTIGTVYSDSFLIALSNERIEGGTNNIATIFPNPSSDGQFGIKLFEQSSEKIEVSIFNISGQLLYDETFNSSSDIINVRVVQPLAAGFYIVKIRSGKKEQYLKWQRI
jgi:hypothetical protein